MEEILIISTGGTFNKIYDPIKGKLTVDNKSNALKDILSKWLCTFEIMSIIGKDSLDMDDNDRGLLSQTICNAKQTKIIVIHGTDTMDLSAQAVSDQNCKKRVIFTGAMVPYSIDSTEATANLSSAIGYAQASSDSGVFIAMNGICDNHDEVKKDRTKGKFIKN